MSGTASWQENVSLSLLSWTNVRPALLKKPNHMSGMVLQVVLRLLQTNHCPLRRWTVHLKLDTVQFSASLITQRSNVQVIWWHTPVIAYVSAVVLWHKLQLESGKHHWVSLHLVFLSAQKDKPVFRFLLILLVHLSFMKKKPSSFLCTAPKSLDLDLSQQWGRALCNVVLVPQTRDLATGINMEKQRPRAEVTAQCPLTRSKLPLTVLKTQTLFLWDLRNRHATNERQQQTGNLCVWAGIPTTYCRNSYLFYAVTYTS